MGEKQVRVWMDGCFDMMHWGHANALRQGSMLGNYLVVGVHSDADIRHHKGPPVMTEEERYQAVEACKWVDEVVRGAPWNTNMDVLAEYNIDFCVHGDDVVLSRDGNDPYSQVKAKNMFRTVPRTIGVSTTDLVGRMLLMTNEHFCNKSTSNVTLEPVSTSVVKKVEKKEKEVVSPYTKLSQLLPSTKRIVQFSSGSEPKPTDKIVYVDGAFDLFHVGHIAFLKEARKHGDYLIVGVCEDHVINQFKGSNYPIMNLHERVLGVLSCRYVDEVIIGAPWRVTDQMLKDLNIAVVVHGTVFEPSCKAMYDPDDAYAAAKKEGILKCVKSPCDLTTNTLIDRIIENRLRFEQRNRKKQEREVKQLQDDEKEEE